ncbi:MAG: hypothetical protein H0T79_13510 [Deltaproteobacteria bacterium]|nr:hypothetical protein [Deltaproteobacteria bacterium]
MSRRSPPRIEWSPDSTRFLARLGDDRIRLHAADGSLLRSMGTALDVRWAGELVISLDDRSTLRWHGPHGVVDQRRTNTGSYAAPVACFARDVERIAFTTDRGDVGVVTFDASVWALDRKRHVLPPELTVVLSPDGARLAIGFESDAPVGRGFVMFDLATDTVLERGFIELPTRLDAPMSFAFDRVGARCAPCHPEQVAGLGVLHVGHGKVGQQPRHHPGGVTAVALEPLGMIAAYAYADAQPGTAGRLQFDFLSPDPPVGSSVEVHSTLVLDVALPDIVALGFDPTSRWLACLASTGEIEIIVVP